MTRKNLRNKIILLLSFFILGTHSLNMFTGVITDYATMHRIYPALDQITFFQIKQACSVAGVNELYEFAKIHAESNFSNTAISSAGALGISQLMPETAAGYGAAPWIQYENILAGAKHLKYCLSKTIIKNDYFEGLCKYNAGQNRKTYPSSSKLYAVNCIQQAKILMVM